jgi:hypothetical protein
VLFAIDDPWQPEVNHRPAITTRFTAVAFRDRSCGTEIVPVAMRYEGRRSDADLSDTVNVDLRGENEGGRCCLQSTTGRTTTSAFAASSWQARTRGVSLAFRASKGSNRSRCF